MTGPRSEPSNEIPHYLRIKERILSLIVEGKLKPGDRVYSESELVTSFGVSRMTANRALRELMFEGVLTRCAGLGTFVAAQRQDVDLLQIRNIADEISARGHSHAAEVLAADRIKADRRIAQALDLPSGTEVMHTLIVPEHVWSKVADPSKEANETPVGSGPFTEVVVFENQIYALGANPNYWQEGKPYIKGLRFPAYPSNDAAQLALLSGEVDWAGNFVPDIENTYVAKGAGNYGYWFPGTGDTIMLFLNTTKAPFDNVDVRKAISKAIEPSVLRRPKRSATRPDTTMPTAMMRPPQIWMTRKSAASRSEYSLIHDSGNTVTRWNRA